MLLFGIFNSDFLGHCGIRHDVSHNKYKLMGYIMTPEQAEKERLVKQFAFQERTLKGASEVQIKSLQATAAASAAEVIRLTALGQESSNLPHAQESVAALTKVSSGRTR